MLQEMEQSFTALSSRDKMKFLRWAAESIGAKIDLGHQVPEPLVPEDSRLNNPDFHGQDVDIPEFLKRKSG